MENEEFRRKNGGMDCPPPKTRKERNVERFKLGRALCGKKRTRQPGVQVVELPWLLTE